MTVYVRTTVLLDDDIYEKLTIIQRKLMEKESRHVTFLEVVRMMTRMGLEKKSRNYLYGAECEGRH